MTNGQNATRGRHLDDLAAAIKRFTLQEILDVTNAVAAELENISISGGGSSSSEIVLPTVVSSVDGGFWYELTDNVPTLWLRQDDWGYGFNFAKARFIGDLSDALAAYLKFDSSAIADACGNEWTATGDVSLSTEIKKFGTSSVYLPQGTCLSAPMPLDINIDKWTFDAWAYLIKGGILFSLGASAINSVIAIRVDRGMFHAPNSSGSSYEFADGYTALTFNEWHHVAIVKNGTSLKLFIDGTLTLDKTLANTMYDGGFFLLGTTYNKSDYQPNFYVDNVRLFRDVALWDSDFTPPTAADYER